MICHKGPTLRQDSTRQWRSVPTLPATYAKQSENLADLDNAQEARRVARPRGYEWILEVKRADSGKHRGPGEDDAAALEVRGGHVFEPVEDVSRIRHEARTK